MNILMGINTPWVGGTRTHALTLAKALLGRGHRLTLVTDQGVLEQEMVEKGIPFRTRRDGLGPMLDLMLSVVEAECPAVLHAHPHESILESFLLSNLTGIPFMVTMHGEYLMHFERNRLGARIGQAAHTVVAVSDRVRDYLLEWSVLPPEKIRVVPNGVDTGEFRPGLDATRLRAGLGIRPDEMVVLYLGRLDADKRPAILTAAEAVRYLATHGIRIKGLFVGQGDMYAALDAMRREISRETGVETIILTGFRRDLPELLSLADVVVATGRAALEAMAVGKPVFAYGRAGCLGLVTAGQWNRARETNFGDHGSLPQPGYRDLADQLVQVHLDGVLRAALGRDLRRLVIKHYDIQKVAEELEALYSEAVGQAVGRPPVRP